MGLVSPENTDTNHAYSAKETTKSPHDGRVPNFKIGFRETISQNRRPTNPSDTELRAGPLLSIAPRENSGAINNKIKNNAKQMWSRLISHHP